MKVGILDSQVCHLRKVPWDAVILCLSLLYPTLQPAVGKGVAFVEVQVALIFKEAVPSTGVHVPEIIGGNQGGGEVDEMFQPWSELNTMLSHHWELVWGSDKDAESTMALAESAKGNRVRVQIQR